MRDYEEKLKEILPFTPLCPPKPTTTVPTRVKGELVKVTKERLLPRYGVHAEKLILFVVEQKRSGMPKFASSPSPLPSYIQSGTTYHHPDMKWEVAKGGTNRGVLVKNPPNSKEKVGFFPMQKYVGYLCKVAWMGSVNALGEPENVLRVDLKEYEGFMPKKAVLSPLGLEELIVMVEEIKEKK